MILVDTSIWVSFFNDRHREGNTAHLRDLINSGAELALTDLILTEILQGFRDERMFREVRDYLFNFPIFRANSLGTFIQAAQLHRHCRRMGMTIRTTVDCIIAAVAMEHRLELFHNDRDFDVIARYAPLTLYHRPAM